MQAAPKPQMSRAEKLRWYSNQLMTDATEAEKAGNAETAISNYLQAAEIWLLLAKVEQSYPSWKAYTDAASQCQHKAKSLIAVASKGAAPPP